ncbi:MAG: DUF4175 domain-containing protein [Candidatus Cloacimonetes bacterium]|nr:hypothetical protein [Candidatus Cloacimonadota bacterium]NLO12241.1 DUF4175 domain-containing protein [Candidatus Cloacimonadota bacterium]
MERFNKTLKKLRFQLNAAIIGRAVISALIVFLLALHVYFIAWLGFGAHNRVLPYVNISLRTGTVLIAFYLILSANNALLSRLQVARWMDLKIDHQDDLYQNLIELKEQGEDEAIVDVLAIQAQKRVQEGNYKPPRWFKAAQVFTILFFLAGLGVMWGLSSQNFVLALRQFYSNTPQSIDYKKTIDVSPGSVTIGKGEELVISVLDADPRLTHRLFFRYGTAWRELGMGDNRYRFASLEDDIEYYVANEVAKSDTFRVKCLDEPYVRRWEVRYQYPPHTGLPARTDTLSLGNIEAYRHTVVNLNIHTNIPVKTAQMRFADGKTLDLQGDGNSFSLQIRVDQPTTWHLELNDALGRRNRPEEKSIQVLADLPPEVKILFPGEDTTLDQRMKLPLIISANDDFGLKDLSLRYHINDSPVQEVKIKSIIPSKVHNQDYLFDLKPFDLFPGDRVTYWAQVWDNSPDRQKAESARYVARFPSIAEIYEEIQRQESLKTSELQQSLEQTRDLQKEFEQKRRELLKEPDPSWQDKKQLEDILQQQEELAENVDNIAQDFQDLIDRLHNNEALSAETLQKMQKIQELMEEISNDELRAAMDKFQDALENMNPQDLLKAMEEFKFSMEDFAQRIDQTLQLLESIKKEQAVEKALQISQEIEKSQAALKDKTADSKQNPQSLAADQDNIRERYDELKKELENLSKMLDPQRDKEVMQQLQDLMQDMKQSRPEDDMSSSAQSMRQNRPQSSMQSQSAALEKMRRFTMKLGEMKESMGGGSQREISQAMQTAIRELLIFSKNHESLHGRLGDDPFPIMQELIAQYDGLQILVNKLFATPQMTLFVPPKFYMDLSDTNRAYRDIFINVSEMQYYRLPEHMKTIQKGLNLMVYDLMQALNDSSSGGGGGGMESLMQMLQQMGQEQMAMQMLTQQLMMQLQQQGGRMDAAMQQQIQKLAADQQRLADNLKRALQNDPEAQKQGNAIKQIIEEAEAVARQLRSNQLNQDLLRRQENIISRLLDAQRSINKRDTTQKRKGETAQQQFPQQRGEIDLQELRRAALLDDSYKSLPPAYQQLIIKYLRYLSDTGL